MAVESTSEIAFQIYALAYRFGIVAAGLFSVWLGYRLFVLGVMPKSGSEIDANAGEIRLTLKNAAPGTCFAAFGALVIAVMVFQGNPQLSIKEAAQHGSTTREVSLRSNVTADIEPGRRHEEAGDLDAAVRAYGNALSERNLPFSEAARVLERLAAVRLKQERFDEAFAYASVVFEADPTNANNLAVIAQIESARGNWEVAKQAACQAMTFDDTIKAQFKDSISVADCVESEVSR